MKLSKIGAGLLALFLSSTGCGGDEEEPSSACELLEECCALFPEDDTTGQQAACEGFLPTEGERDEEAEDLAQIQCATALSGFATAGVCEEPEIPEAEDDDNAGEDDEATGGEEGEEESEDESEEKTEET